MTVDRGTGGCWGRKNRETVTASFRLVFKESFPTLAPRLIRSIENVKFGETVRTWPAVRLFGRNPNWVLWRILRFRMEQNFSQTA